MLWPRATISSGEAERPCQATPNGSPAATIPRSRKPSAAHRSPTTTSSPRPVLTQGRQSHRRARANSRQFQTAATNAALARENRLQAGAAELPTVNALNQFIYTEGNETPSGVFVSNDGVHVYNPSGKLVGKIYIGQTSANFQFAGQGRMVICGETELYYVTLAAKGTAIL